MPLTVALLAMIPVIPRIRVAAWSEHPTIDRTIRCRKVVLNGDAEAWCHVRERIDRAVRTHRWSEWLWSSVDGHKVRHQYP